MENRTILVTGIGGNVGQGIVRNIKSSFPELEVIGTNVESFSQGNHLCDKVFKVPFAYDKDFIAEMKKIVSENNVSLIVPSTDYESYYLSTDSFLFERSSCSPEETTKIFLNKMETWKAFSRCNIPFANSCEIANYSNQYQNFIVKPKEGRGSRGIHINPVDLTEFDDSYMIQELATGKEITCAFYVNKSGELHGLITLERKLQNGTSTDCKVTNTYNDKLRPILQSIINQFKIKGASNLQCIAQEDGQIIPFEVNGRISGTNSIRSQFGFEDVKYTIEEYYFNKKPSQPNIKTGIATRILMDVIFTEKEDFNNIDASSIHYIY